MKEENKVMVELTKCGCESVTLTQTERKTRRKTNENNTLEKQRPRGAQAHRLTVLIRVIWSILYDNWAAHRYYC